MLTTDFLIAKEELRTLIDAYATLGDERNITEQMQLFTPDAQYQVYMNGQLVADTTGTDKLAQEFSGHAAQVKTYFTLNGQHSVEVSGDTATGTSFSLLKMVRAGADATDVVTDYSVKYVDRYVRQDGKWRISHRVGHFLIVETRPLA